MQIPTRSTRLFGVLGAVLAIVLGVVTLRRTSEVEVPVAPGSWDPVE
jgi:hypothetical protein